MLLIVVIILSCWGHCCGFSSPFPTFIILPGFGNDRIDYINPLNRGEEYGFVQILAKRGIETAVVPVKRLDWLKIIGGAIADPWAFYKSNCKPNILFKFYFEKVIETLKEEYKKSGDKKLVLIAHSAGGWLARAVLADDSEVSDYVCGLVTLGTPHYPPSGEFANDATRGAINFVDKNYPGNHLSKTKNIFYISVAGTAVTSKSGKNTIESFAMDSYKAVTGDFKEGVSGDGVVPLSSALLQNSEHIILQCYHSIQAPGDYWYGGDKVVDQWLEAVLKRIKNNETKI